MRRRRWRRRRRGRPSLALFLAIVLLAAGVVEADRLLAPSLAALAAQQARTWAESAINRAVQQEIGSQIRYSDLYTVVRGGGGQVDFLQPNTPRINALIAAVTLDAERQLGQLDRQTVPIPLGQLLHIRLLATLGPAIPVAVEPIGPVSAEVSSRFESAGINQTRHVVSLRLTSRVAVVIPPVVRSLQVAQNVPIAEAIIVGPVPPSLFSWPGTTGSGGPAAPGSLQGRPPARFPAPAGAGEGSSGPITEKSGSVNSDELSRIRRI
ncbi:MAG: sporulation protein YunB [Bacillota bacterium]|nr:sporulation protein YunB [Bacillota bacterium]